MVNNLLRVVYFSHNLITENLDDEINEILRVAQKNNLKKGICGALVFNKGIFGQILEGPTQEVEDTFELIQNDRRHHNVTILDLRPIDKVSFENWSMGFVGSEDALIGHFESLTGRSECDVSALNADQMFQVLNNLALKHELSNNALV